MSQYVKNAWYAAACSEELKDTPVSRVLLEQRVVLFRTQAGAPAALLDRCVHRFAPLSMGQVEGDSIACLYHGMRFGADGRCTHVPGQTHIPSGAAVRHFPTLERYGLVFVWMGDPAAADPTQLLDIERYGQSGWGLSRGYTLFGSSWQNIADNLIDPAHTSFVHQRTIGNAAGDEVQVQAREIGNNTVECGRWIDNAPPVNIVRRFTGIETPVDRWQFYYVKSPNTAWVDFGAMPTGLPHVPEELDRAPYRVLSYAFITPEGPSATHYFSLQLRNFAADDEAVTEEMNTLYKVTFDEDQDLLEAIQREEDANPGLVPLRIASDAGVARLRRVIERQLAAEQSETPAGA